MHIEDKSLKLSNTWSNRSNKCKKRNNIQVNLVHSHVFNISKEYLQACKLTNHNTLSPKLIVFSEILKATVLTSNSFLSFQEKFSVFSFDLSKVPFGVLWGVMGVFFWILESSIYTLTLTVIFCLDFLFKSHINSICCLIIASIVAC